MIYEQPRMRPRKWDPQKSLRFWDTDRSSNISQTTRPCDNQQKKDNLPNSELCCSTWSLGKTDGNRKKDKYLDFAWVLKKLWNMKVTVIPIVIGALGTVTTGLEQG